MGKWNTPLSEEKAAAYSKKFGKEVKYLCPMTIKYKTRYGKWVTVPQGYPSDGATGAFDVNTRGWWVHDKLCDTGKFDDGSLCDNWQASMVLRDLLLEDGFYFRAHRWLIATWLFGGGKARDNGMF